MLHRDRPAAPVRALALAAVLPLALAGCGSAADTAPADTTSPQAASPTGPAQEEPQIPQELQDFYHQDAQWEACGANNECATITVPLDYAQPEGETIELFLKRGPEPTGTSQGSLLLNPGGPGGEAASLIDNAAFLFSANLRENYRLVAMDPRGVGQSTPVECVSDPELDTVLSASYDLESEAGVQAYLGEVERIAQQCAEESGVELLANITTEDAARDMDIVRSVLDEDELNYLGFSYGTFLGATYAHLFPQNVGRMVLDGGLDPTLTTHEVVLGQAQGFEGALRAWAEDCAARGDSCPFSGAPEDIVESVAGLLAQTYDAPLSSQSGRSVTPTLATMGVLTALYNEQFWPQLDFALRLALEGDGTGLLALADAGSGRQPDGSYASNASEALWAINCADHPAHGDPQRWQQDAQELVAAAPIFGPSLAYADALCALWPQEAQPEEPVTTLSAPNAPPILVVGTTHDPATPYAWSESLVELIGPSAQLMTVEGHGHTAYLGGPPACVADHVEGYLIEGHLPPEDAAC